MARTLNPCPPAPADRNPWLGHAETKLTVQVVTPMFGGGVEPGQPDPVTLIRVPSIRGHLRFWWRATRGAAYGDVEALRRREAKIWGDTENPSPVVVTTSLIDAGRRTPCAHLPPGKSLPRFERNHPGYALFPFQGNERKKIPISDGVYGLSFCVKIRSPREVTNDVTAALWAWLNWGGLGARTRRGCGALYCEDYAPSGIDHDSVEEWIATWIQRLAISGSGLMRDWPCLSGTMFLGQGLQDILVAWNRGIGVFQQFRQGESIGRNRGQSQRPARSRWPEPETIRRATGQRHNRHQRLSHIPDNCYPRAEFGLPIIFHFKDFGEPPDTSLEPSVDSTRFSSPLIIRPLVASDGKCAPVVVPLRGPTPSLCVLKPSGGGNPIETKAVRDPSACEYEGSPLRARTRSGSAVEAFLAFIQEREQGFQRVEVAL